MKTQSQIKQTSFHPTRGFIYNYQKLVKDTVIPYQYEVLNDRAEDAPKSHVIQNFINAANVLRGKDKGDGFYGMVFQDSDAGKWLEAVAYSLSIFPDEKMEANADALIDLMAAAQDANGYLDTYFIIENQEKRWTNLLEAHELYCAGHLLEGACAYYEATGKRKFLDVMTKYVEHIYDVFINEKKEGYPGHPEIELALLKLYELTGNEHALALAEHFINVRGVDPFYYEKEVKSRDWIVWGSDATNHRYQQSHEPVRDFKEATGHAVRAVYLYTAMAHLASRTNDAELLAACKRLWKNITECQMYITGGIGSTVHGEAFSVNYDLPNDTAYAETCASIGLMFFASKMLENEIDGKYGDVMEQAFYNTVLAGMELDGKRFFYVNPLESIPGIAEETATRKHDLTRRPGWYACACCPPNAARLISSFGKYAYGENASTAFCHMFAAGTVDFENGLHVECSTEYPYDFTVNYEVTGHNTLAIRIPAWSKNTTIRINGLACTLPLEKGYLYLPIEGKASVTIELDSTPRIMYPSAKVPALTGYGCVMRGPLVYCFEGVDNDNDVLSLKLRNDAPITVLEEGSMLPSMVAKHRISDAKLKEQLCGATKLRVPATRITVSEALYSDEAPTSVNCDAIAIPYYTWCNREKSQMRVWLPLH